VLRAVELASVCVIGHYHIVEVRIFHAIGFNETDTIMSSSILIY